MQTSDSPSLIPIPFANSGARNTIPTMPPSTPGLASLESGFPPVTMTPVAAGGIPPSGMDFNGILNLLSDSVRWFQAGGSFSYNAEFSTAIGGYPLGAVLLSADGSGFWRSAINNNTSNPDGGGSGWVPVINNAATTTAAGIVRLATIAEAQGLVASGVALTPQGLGSITSSEARNGIIRLATSALAQGLTDDVTAITPKKLADAFRGANQSLGLNGFQRLPGGLIVQWGFATTNASGRAAVTFPLAFPIALDRAIVNPVNANATVGSQNSAGPTGFDHNILNAATAGLVAAGVTVGYYAIGR